MVITNLTHDHSNTTTNSYATASISPQANTLILLAVGANTSNVAAATASGASLTWTQVATISTTNTTMTILRALSSSPGTGAITISFSANQSNVYWSINQFLGVDTSGTNGANAVVQSVTGTTTSTNTGQTVTLSTLGSNQNVAYGAIMNSTNTAITKGSSFTELTNIADFQIFEDEYAINQTAVNWSWSSTGQQTSAIALEIKALQTGGGFIFPLL